MTTRDKFSQAFALMMGDAIKIVVKKATTRVDAPPKRKHVQTLSQYLENPRANIPYLVDCLSIRFRKPCWLISMKALLTTQLLLYSDNENFIKHVSARTLLFDLSGYIDRSSLKSVELSVFVAKYAKFLKLKCEAYRILGRDVSKASEPANAISIDNIPKVFEELNILGEVLRAAYANDVDFSSNSPLFHTVHVFLLKESLRVFTSYNRRVIFLLENLRDLEAKEASEVVRVYKDLCELHAPLQSMVEIAANKGLEGVKGLKLSKPSIELVDSIEEFVKEIIRIRGSRKLQEKWKLEPNQNVKPLPASLTKRIQSIDFDPFLEMTKLENRFEPNNLYSTGESFDMLIEESHNKQDNQPRMITTDNQFNQQRMITSDVHFNQPAILYNNQQVSSQYECTINSPRQLPMNNIQSPQQHQQYGDNAFDFTHPNSKDLDQLLMENINFSGQQQTQTSNKNIASNDYSTSMYTSSSGYNQPQQYNKDNKNPFF